MTLSISLKIVFAVGLLLIPFVTQAQQNRSTNQADFISATDKPIILDHSIIFNDHSVMPITRKELKLFKNPNAAVSAGNLPISYSQEVISVSGWKQILVMTHHKLFEGEVTQVTRYDYNGNIMSRRQFEGTVKVLEKSKRLLLAGISSHFMAKETLILDVQDKIIAKLKYGEFLPRIFGLNISKDEELIWFYSRDSEISSKKTNSAGVPFTHITVIDHDGNLIKRFKSFQNETILVRFKNKEYAIETGVPDFPG